MKILGVSIICASTISGVVAGASALNYTDAETKFSHSLDWCVGNDTHPIRWINKEEAAVNAKVAAGARPAPARDKKGRIRDLDAFVRDRRSTLPPEVVLENLPTLIIENECASVTVPSENCIFDYGAFLV